VTVLAWAAGGTATFIDVEHALDTQYAGNLGVDMDELYIAQPQSGEQARLPQRKVLSHTASHTNPRTALRSNKNREDLRQRKFHSREKYLLMYSLSCLRAV
jgi:hypothetical protein